MSKQRIIFFGSEETSLVSLKALVENDFNVVAVITKPDSRRGRGQKLASPAVKQYAESKNIEVWQPVKFGEVNDKIRALQPVTGVLVVYGKIIPQATIDLFTPAIVNVHPSLLPEYRGPSPIESAIVNRDGRTGVSLMALEKAMDAGPVYIQSIYALDQNETRPELYNTLGQIGANLLVNHLPAIISGEMKPKPQDEAKATYCSLLDKSMALIDPSKTTPGAAEAHIRGYLGFPRSRMVVAGQEVIITKAHAQIDKTSELDIEFSNGAFLHIDELITRNGKTVQGQSFLNGLKK